MGVVIAFVDDSKQKSRRAGMGALLSLGAVIFPIEKVKPFTDAVDALLDSHEVPRAVELKWSPDSKNDWFRDNSKTQLVTPIRQEVLRLVQSNGGKVVAVIWDTTLQPTLWGKPAEGHVVEWLWERLSMRIQNSEDLGVVVFDKPGGDTKAEDKWISGTVDLTAGGNKFVSADAIVMPFLTAPSHHHRHIQAADLIVGSLTAAIAGNPYGLALIPYLRPLLHRNANGDVGGAGIKLYPDSINNLLHWGLGEEQFSNSKGRWSVTLPDQRFQFFQSDPGLPSAALAL